MRCELSASRTSAIKHSEGATQRTQIATETRPLFWRIETRRPVATLAWCCRQRSFSCGAEIASTTLVTSRLTTHNAMIAGSKIWQSRPCMLTTSLRPV
jgi:hypothetical protein